MDLKIGDLKNAMLSPSEILEQKWRLCELRFKFAWNSFEFHANQRMTMFNFFILFSGILSTAYAYLMRAKCPYLASGSLVLGCILCFLFLFLERRNEELVHIAEDTLLALEEDVIFQGYEREIWWPKRKCILGCMDERPKTWQLGIHLREKRDIEKKGKSLYIH